ncbi:MAG: tyrosine recombinase XerS [Paenisporosarcina sp.]|nr:tyrosine recombinase XerS [Paenisporosarcina sp.]
MPAPTRKTIFAEQHIEAALLSMPDYVEEFVVSKRRTHSPTTLSGYLHDYKKFFDWLRKKELTDAASNKEIPYTILQHLKKTDMESFFNQIALEKIKKGPNNAPIRSDASLNRFIQSLKTLFSYLTTETENEDGECYFDRNVMKKIKTNKNSETTASRAKRINSNSLKSDEMDDFLDFIRFSYADKLQPRQKSRFERDRLRDIAIVSLFQGSGIRVNELAGLLIKDIDFQNGDLTTLRKGNKLDTVSITNTALKDLKTYIDEREHIYKPDAKNQFVFLTKYRGTANPISVEAVQRIVNKYSQAFLLGKRISPHKLRHSFAKKWLDKGGPLVGLRDQLGHNSIHTTSNYTNFSQNEQRIHLDTMDSKSNDNNSDDS